jgi:hypothetical protein
MILLTKFQAKRITFGCARAKSYLADMYSHPMIHQCFTFISLKNHSINFIFWKCTQISTGRLRMSMIGNLGRQWSGLCDVWLSITRNLYQQDQTPRHSPQAASALVIQVSSLYQEADRSITSPWTLE